MKLHSYILVTDSGFAPNPFCGFCTLATCKPVIRRSAKVGDWIVGTGSKDRVGQGKLVYAMRVDEVLSLEKYATDPRFEEKKPRAGSPKTFCGDNIYFKNESGAWKQHPSYHTAKDMKRDLSGKNVLISETFYYFGGNAVDIPKEYKALVPSGRGHRNKHNLELVADFIHWLQANYSHGIHGKPAQFYRKAQPNKSFQPTRLRLLVMHVVAFLVACVVALAGG
jgi:hypothetical protein